MNKRKLFTGETLVETVLDNGLSVFVLEKPGFQKKHAVYATHYGAIDSTFQVDGEQISVPDGIAHFLEHKLFEEEDGHVFDNFSQFGASVNAYTSYTTTAYLFSTINHFYDALTELVGFVNRPYLTAENVEKEKGIIEQELRMYDDHPDRKIYKNLLEALYVNHPVQIDIGGTVESIHQIDVDTLTRCYHAFYQPKNMALLVVGDVRAEQVVQTVNSEISKYELPPARDIKRIYPDEPDQVDQEFVEARLPISRPRYYLGLKSKPQGEGGELLKQQLSTNLAWRLLSGRSSALYEELYEKDIIDDTFGASFTCSRQYAYSIVGGETDNPEDFDKQIRQAINGMKQQSMSDLELKRLKRQAYGAHLRSFNSLDYLANGFISHYFNGTTLLGFTDVLEGITRNDIDEALHSLNLDNASVSVLLPD